MNIFYLDDDPVVCAQYHCDKHVVKMILEHLQMICTNLYLDGRIEKESYVSPGFKNHPCTIWARQSYENEKYLRDLTFSLLLEYEFRYGKLHTSAFKYAGLIEIDRPKIGFTQPAQAMPDYCKVPDNSVKAYRNYYLYEKVRFARWSKRSIPEWFTCSQ
jgi:hypothetical protein